MIDRYIWPARGDEACIRCHLPIEREYTHLTEPSGFDVIVCLPCFNEALLEEMAQ